MVVTITPAQPHGVIGPGIPIRLQSTVSLPIGVPCVWSINWFTPGGPVPAFHQDSFSPQGNPPDQVVVPWTAHINPTINIVDGAARTDDQVSLEVHLNRQDTGGALDTGNITAPYDAETGLSNVIVMQPQATGGGLTTEQAAQLEETHQATRTDLVTETGATVTVDLSQLLKIPDLGQLVVQATSHELTGRGSLNVPVFASVVGAYGVTLLIGQRPPGAGRRDGFKLVFSERAGQFILGDTELVTAEARFVTYVDLHEEALTVLFDQFAPTFIAYDITPGFSVVLRWLVLR